MTRKREAGVKVSGQSTKDTAPGGGRGKHGGAKKASAERDAEKAVHEKAAAPPGSQCDGCDAWLDHGKLTPDALYSCCDQWFSLAFEIGTEFNPLENPPRVLPRLEDVTEVLSVAAMGRNLGPQAVAIRRFAVVGSGMQDAITAVQTLQDKFRYEIACRLAEREKAGVAGEGAAETVTTPRVSATVCEQELVGPETMCKRLNWRKQTLWNHNSKAVKDAMHPWNHVLFVDPESGKRSYRPWGLPTFRDAMKRHRGAVKDGDVLGSELSVVKKQFGPTCDVCGKAGVPLRYAEIPIDDKASSQPRKTRLCKGCYGDLPADQKSAFEQHQVDG